MTVNSTATSTFSSSSRGTDARRSRPQQLKDKGYADKYRAEDLPIHLIGVEFSRKTRNVVGFEVELHRA